ncbi:hypothetical protein DFP72DRAFT_476640 [Ephemerocybe angulata]|uniref:Uncharacterized protein n=1 Tax=Ephemerocybe angulata TaxID=980116 RepID=A0A8H6HRQ8_9AGAR|nr:hypothetical protein DFP72DRAFT_476640 [Tulosesus angulatus]
MATLPPYAIISPEECRGILEHLRASNVSLPCFLNSVLYHHAALSTGGHSDMAHFASSLPGVLDNLNNSELTRRATLDWVFKTSTEIHAKEVAELSKEAAGFHFNASNATEDALKEVSVRRLSAAMNTLAPRTCELLGRLLAANDDVVQHRDKKRRQRAEDGGSKKRRRSTHRRGVDVEAEDIQVDDGDEEWVNEEGESRRTASVDLQEESDDENEERQRKIAEMVRVCPIPEIY